MTINYESLLEFEESLRLTSTSGNRALLQNLALKIECARGAYYETDDNTTTEKFTEDDLDKLLSDYKFSEDEFATCSKCGRSLYCDELLYQSCCKAFVTAKSGIFSNLERSYWMSLLSNPTRTINTLPNYTEFLCLKQGIPNQIRSMAWKKLFLLNTNKIPQTSNLVFNNFQHSYSSEISEQISKDLMRTFPTVDFFQQEDTINSLSTVLNVYANYDAELGYCQGLLFLVGVLCYHFHANSELTFHCLISIMESEYELRDIFTASTMSDTLLQWHNEFLDVLKAVDLELYEHITSFVDLQVFLYQWWMSFACSHSPDLSIVNRNMDFCIMQGWKTGLFKISLGLLIINKPILMSLDKGDEEVIYQHMLNESKWGNVINDLDLFFGDLLLSWDDSLFTAEANEVESICTAKTGSPKAANVSLVDKIKNLSILSAPQPPSSSSSSSSSSSFRYRADSSGANRSSQSIFSNPKRATASEMESIYSDISETSLQENGKGLLFSDYLKFPYMSKSHSNDKITDEKIDEEDVEKESMKVLLMKAWILLGDDSAESRLLKSEIAKVVDV